MSIYRFQVSLDNVNKAIEIEDNKTIAEMVYTILAYYNYLDGCLYEIESKTVIFDCGLDYDNYKCISKRIYFADDSILSSYLNIFKEDNVILKYNFDNSIYFKISLLDIFDNRTIFNSKEIEDFIKLIKNKYEEIV